MLRPRYSEQLRRGETNLPEFSGQLSKFSQDNDFFLFFENTKNIMKKLANKMQNPKLSMQFEIFALTLDANVSFAKFILSYWSFGKL